MYDSFLGDVVTRTGKAVQGNPFLPVTVDLLRTLWKR